MGWPWPQKTLARFGERPRGFPPEELLLWVNDLVSLRGEIPEIPRSAWLRE
jgi:hypothetical protein